MQDPEGSVEVAVVDRVNLSCIPCVGRKRRKGNHQRRCIRGSDLDDYDPGSSIDSRGGVGRNFRPIIPGVMREWWA